MKTVDFYFDFLSPFSYFAWINHKNKLKEFDLNFSYKPVLMGRLFGQHGFPGPGEIAAKRAYELKKCFRYGVKNNIAFKPPGQFPFNPLAIIRLGLESVAKQNQYKVIDIIFKEIWEKGQVLEDPEVVQELIKTNNLPVEIIDLSFAREAKLELKQNIKEALSANIFGVPTFKVEDEYFWGNDSFEDMTVFLSGNDNWDKELYNKVLNDNPLPS